ncbi:MAG TPA: universal stress protein [Ramlibacter sp.]|uniref:universal stress protein n=1 Tax=Ramlibacter sp. TaxID=1917967 RepID=UPI002CD0C4DD|nr:universal stress protein [Ramlibacter sp.]HVZ46271.1 universal stress protein [Ramlibacter sp.]
MFRHILVPVDGSSASMQATAKAGGLAQAFGSKVTLLSVIDVYPFVGIGADYAFGQAEYLTAATANANQSLSKAEAVLAQLGVASQRKVTEGHVVHQGITDCAESLGCDLLVMGSHGRHGIDRLLLGSTTQRVLSHCKVPVLVVPGE